MTVMRKPKATFLRGALPTVEEAQAEYVGSVYGAAALGFITSICAADALDALMERCKPLVRGRVAASVRAIMGGGGSSGLLALLRVNINGCMADSESSAWAADFGNAAYGKTEPSLRRLQTAVANTLGRYGAIPDINAFAGLVVAQSVAQEAARYVSRRARQLSGYTVTTRGRQKYSAAFLLRQMSCEGICHHLTIITQELVESRVPNGADLLSDPSVKTGCRAVLNVLGSVDTWVYARDKADELNAGCKDGDAENKNKNSKKKKGNRQWE